MPSRLRRERPQLTATALIEEEFLIRGGTQPIPPSHPHTSSSPSASAVRSAGFPQLEAPSAFSEARTENTVLHSPHRHRKSLLCISSACEGAVRAEVNQIAITCAPSATGPRTFAGQMALAITANRSLATSRLHVRTIPMAELARSVTLQGTDESNNQLCKARRSDYAPAASTAQSGRYRHSLAVSSIRAARIE